MSLPGRARGLLGRGRPGWNFPGLFLPVVALVYLAGVASFAFVWGVDPYDLRPWGVTARLSTSPYVDNATRLLFRTASHDGTDLVVVGGSTSAGYTPSMLRKAFPWAKRPVNLSFEGVSGEDLEAELARLESSGTLKLLIFSLEFPIAKDIPTFGRIAGKPPFDGSWLNPVPDYDVQAVEIAARELRTGVLDAPDWRDPSLTQPDFMIGRTPIAASAVKMERLMNDAAVSRAWVAAAPDLPCSTFPILKPIVRDLRNLARKGVKVDVLLPVYPLALYSDWSVTPLPYLRKAFAARGSVFATMVSLRRCALQMTAGEPDIQVFGFDTDEALTGNLALYYDTSHLLDPSSFQALLLRVAHGEGRVTVAAWPAYEARLREEVRQYRPHAGPVTMAAAPSPPR